MTDETAGFAQQIRQSQPRLEAAISEVTGWQGVGNLARWMVDLLVANIGSSGCDDVRPPCWKNHIPQSVPEFTQMMVEVSGRPADDPAIQKLVEEHKRMLCQMFGL